VLVPTPAITALVVFKSLTSVQVYPFHNSVAAVSPGAIGILLEPPNARALVLPVPAPPKISSTSV
jgi:hypothetical protein